MFHRIQQLAIATVICALLAGSVLAHDTTSGHNHDDPWDHDSNPNTPEIDVNNMCHHITTVNCSTNEQWTAGYWAFIKHQASWTSYQSQLQVHTDKVSENPNREAPRIPDIPTTVEEVVSDNIQHLDRDRNPYHAQPSDWQGCLDINRDGTSKGDKQSEIYGNSPDWQTNTEGRGSNDNTDCDNRVQQIATETGHDPDFVFTCLAAANERELSHITITDGQCSGG